MADLSHKLEMVLDKLYNLKGEDNVILVKINKDIKDTEKAIEKAREDQQVNEGNKNDSEAKLRVFTEQKQVFEECFDEMTDDAFAALRDIGVNLDLGTMLESVKTKSPEYIASLEGEIEKYENAIAELVEKGRELSETLAAHNEAKAKAEEDQRKLIDLLEQSLSTESIERESLTVHYVKAIISSFGIFDDAELSKLSKLIMFPDEGLIDYDRNYASRSFAEKQPVQEVPEEKTAENVVEVESEFVPTDDAPQVEETVEETIVNDSTTTEEVTHEDIKDNLIIVPGLGEETEEETPQPEETEEPIKEDTSSEEVVEETSFDKKKLESELSEIGLDIEKFEQENDGLIANVYEELSKAETKLIETNYELLRSIDATDCIYKMVNGHLYLTDKDLSRKLTLLRSKGISESKITSLVTGNDSGMRESYEVLESKITAIEETAKRIDDSNISAINKNIAQYARNIEILQDRGYELEDKEIDAHSALLYESKYIEDDAEVLKKYLISIQRGNGKYALNVFYQTPEDLLYGIDNLVESDLENMIISNPEVLSYQLNGVIGRIKYCEENGIPIYKDNENTFMKYIVDYNEFRHKFGTNVILPTLPTRELTNGNLPEIIGNEVVEIMVNTLNEYYSSKDFLHEPKLDADSQERLEALQNKLEMEYGAQTTGKLTYNIAGVNISKVKFERNLRALISAMVVSGQSLEGLDAELILTAALHNCCQETSVLAEVVGNCLGFNQENTLGGVVL